MTDHKEILAYPGESEIYEFFDKYIHFDNARVFFKQKGIIFATSRQGVISEYASKSIFGFEVFQMIKSITSTKQRYSKISGFQIKTSKDTKEILDGFQPGRIISDRNQLKILNVILLQCDDIINISYSFERKTPGKMNLISAEKRNGEFSIEKRIGSTTRIVFFNHSKNEDYTAVRDIICSIKEDDDGDSFFEIIPIKLIHLPISKRISVIDRILKQDYLNWVLEGVIQITVKNGRDLLESSEGERDESAGSDDEIVPNEGDLENEELVGINNAVLTGQNLRENSFVKKCEKHGFYFPSIMMRMAHKTEPYIMNLEVQFKIRPEMPEVRIDASFIVEDSIEKPYEFDPDFKIITLKMFMLDFLKIYNEIAQIE